MTTKTSYDIDGLVQDCSIPSALAMEMLQSYTKPSPDSKVHGCQHFGPVNFAIWVDTLAGWNHNHKKNRFCSKCYLWFRFHELGNREISRGLKMIHPFHLEISLPLDVTHAWRLTSVGCYGCEACQQERQGCQIGRHDYLTGIKNILS